MACEFSQNKMKESKSDSGPFRKLALKMILQQQRETANEQTSCETTDPIKADVRRLEHNVHLRFGK
jgi:hypothetical protein